MYYCCFAPFFQLIKRRGISARKVAKATGISRSTMYRMYQNALDPINAKINFTINLLLILCSYLHCPMEQVVELRLVQQECIVC